MQRMCYVAIAIHCHKNVLVARNSTATKIICLAIQTMPTNYLAWLPSVAIWSMATKNISWQKIILQRYDCRCNNVWSLTTIKITWKIILLPRHDYRGNNLFCNKIMAWQIPAIATSLIVAYTTSCNGGGRGNCLYCHDHERCDNILLPCLATDNYGCKKPQ